MNTTNNFFSLLLGRMMEQGLSNLNFADVKFLVCFFGTSFKG